MLKFLFIFFKKFFNISLSHTDTFKKNFILEIEVINCNCNSLTKLQDLEVFVNMDLFCVVFPGWERCVRGCSMWLTRLCLAAVTVSQSLRLSSYTVSPPYSGEPSSSTLAASS